MRVLKVMKKKLKSKRGFTLLEMLVALAIVVMMSLMMSVGISVGTAVQRESTFVSESDVLASTLNTALGDVLRYATVRPVALAEGEGTPSNEQVEAGKTLLVNAANAKCLIDVDGYGISGGAIYLDSYSGDNGKLRLAVSQYVTQAVDGDSSKTITKETVSYLASHGIYTNLVIMRDVDHPFTLTYEEDGNKKYFHVHYWIAESRTTDPMTKEVEAYFRVANE